MIYYWRRYYFVANLIILLPLTGCIEPYYPAEDELKTGIVVVNAHLTSKPGLQFIELSRSSTILFPKYDPLPGCYVKVESQEGDFSEFEETDPGKYRCLLDEDFLGYQQEYRLVFITSDGYEYESEWEMLHPPVGIVSVYWNLEYHPTADQEVTWEGVQFYLDFEIDKESSSYLRWEVDETYEIHNPEYKSFVVDGDRKVKAMSDSSLWRTCWITREIPRIYIKDLEPVEGEIYRRMPLNYVNCATRRLNHRYSILVRQLSLSKSSFNYWKKLEINLQSNGGLFDQQPMLTPGNICRVSDQEEVVLGYFSISSVTETRVFLDSIPGLKLRDDPENCYPGELPAMFYYIVLNYPPNQPPIYLSLAYADGGQTFGMVEKQCVDCREYKFSSHIKPDFW